MTGVALNTSQNILLVFNICHFLLIISLIFGKVGLYVTENEITFFRTALVLFNWADLSRLSTLSIWFWMMFFLYIFSTNRLIKVFEYFLYLSKVEQTRFIFNAWRQGILFFSGDDVQILLGDNFGDLLVFHKVLLANDRYGFYKLKCLKIQFSLWKI